MSRPKSSWGDIANFGANVYQSRQINKLAREQSEANALLQMQIEDMQRQQMMEELKKESLKHARNLILEFEEMITSTQGKVQNNPILASIETDALELAFNDSQSSGMDSDFFEEMYDLERYRKVQSGIGELKQLTSKLTEEQSSIKENIISYSIQFDDYERAIKHAENMPIVQSRYDDLSTELENLQPQWDQFESNAIELNDKKTKMQWVMFSILSIIFIPILLITMFSPEWIGIKADSDAEALFGGGTCLAWIIIGAFVVGFYEERKITIPNRETLIGESAITKIEEELSIFKDADPELFSEEIRELESQLELLNDSSASDINFVVPHSGTPFEEYFVILESTYEKCTARLEIMKKEFQSLTSTLGESKLEELRSSLQTKTEYVEYHLKEDLYASPTFEQTNQIESKINWVLHEGYYYKQFEDGSFESTPHIRNHDGLIVPYQPPNPPNR